MELAYLPHVESSFQARARSSAGAVGIWQFTRGTGRKYLKITSAIDERLDPIAAAHGAAQYLADAYEELASWPIALTAYNHGVGGMAKAVKDHGADYEQIFNEYEGRRFGFASKNFYSEFLAARAIARDPERYFPEGFDAESEQTYAAVELVRHTNTSGTLVRGKAGRWLFLEFNGAGGPMAKGDAIGASRRILNPQGPLSLPCEKISCMRASASPVRDNKGHQTGSAGVVSNKRFTVSSRPGWCEPKGLLA